MGSQLTGSPFTGGTIQPVAVDAEGTLHESLSLSAIVLFAWRTFVYSCVGLAAFLFVWIPNDLIDSVIMSPPNPAINETVITSDWESTSGLFLKVVVPMIRGELMAVNIVPLFFILLVRCTVKRKVLLWATFIGAYAVYVAMRVAGGEKLLGLGGMVSGIMQYASLAYVLPKGSAIPMQYVKQSFATLGLMTFVFTLNFIPDNETANFIFLSLYLPLMREILYAIARSIMRQVSVYASASGEGGGQIHTSFIWLTFLPVQCLMSAILRLFVSNINNPVLLVGVLAYESVIEIVARITIRWRDDVQLRLYKNCKSRFQRRKILPSPDQQAQAVKGLDRATTSGLFFIGKMFSEYLAIITVPLLYYYHFPNRVFVSFPYYASLADPFDSPLDTKPLVFLVGIQLVAEFCVDTVSIWIESKRGHSVVRLWKAGVLGGRILPCIILSGVFSSAFLNFLVAFMDNLTQCKLKDMCFCSHGHGIKQGSLKELYCMRLYPETNGWPDNSTMPVS